MSSLRWFLLTLSFIATTGCATVPGHTEAAPGDPWEGFNRKVFSFNEQVDAAVLRPVAQGYVQAVPQPIRTGIRNALGNVRDAWSSVNHLLQGKGQSGATMGARVLVNTTIGLGGVFDPATSMRLHRHSEDFGQTLARWGVGAGPYVVLPLMGPSTLRDAVASLGVDQLASPSALGGSDAAVYSLAALDMVNTRAALLGMTRLLNDVALDNYLFVRDAYLARRLNAIHDGSPPMRIPEEVYRGTDEGMPPSSAAEGAEAPAQEPRQ